MGASICDTILFPTPGTPGYSVRLCIVVYHNGLLDLYLNVEVDITVIVAEFAGPNNSTVGVESELPVSTNLCSLVDVDEKTLTHDPNDHKSERSARVLCLVANTIPVKDQIHQVDGSENDDVSQAIVKQHLNDRVHSANATGRLDQKER